MVDKFNIYNKIVNPQTNRKINIYSKLGRQILYKYYTNLHGGRPKIHSLSTNLPSAENESIDSGFTYDTKNKVLTIPKVINNKNLIFILEKVCEGTTELNNLEGRGLQKWKEFIDKRYNMIYPYKDQESFEKLYSHENKLFNAWMTNSNEWSEIIKEKDITIDISYPVLVSMNLYKIFEILKEYATHPILQDSLTQEYIDSKKKQLEIQNLYDHNMAEAIGPYKLCINNCKSPNIDMWVAYVIEYEDYSFDLQEFEKTEPIILMTLTISVDFSQDNPYEYHMGIHRSLDYLRNQKKHISAKGSNLGQLSLQLHGFASKGIDYIYNNKRRFIVSDPLHRMQEILEKTGLKMLKGKYTTIMSELEEKKRKESDYEILKNNLSKLSPERQKMAIGPNKYGVANAGRWLKIFNVETGEIIFIFVEDNMCIHPYHTIVSTNFEFNKLFE